MNTCNTCNACKPVNEQTGECHRNPPSVQLVMVPAPPSVGNPRGGQQLAAQRFFPPVALADDFCMMWQAKVPKLAS